MQAAGADLDEVSGAVCFWVGGAEQRKMCLVPAEEDCVAVDSHGRRKLTVDRKLARWDFATIVEDDFVFAIMEFS